MRTSCFMKNRILFCAATLLTSAFLVSCGEKEIEADNKINVFYVKADESSIVPVEYELKTDPAKDMYGAITELVQKLEESPGKSLYEAPISGDESGEKPSEKNGDVVGDAWLNRYTYEHRVLKLEFGAQYGKLGITKEVLTRAAIVSTFTQIDGIDNVYFYVGKKEAVHMNFEGDADSATDDPYEPAPLKDHAGNAIGPMKGEDFIYNVDSEINKNKKEEITLYFANKTGDKLKRVYRYVVYNSNISEEKLRLEQLINGPNTNDAFPTINKETKINSVNIKDKVCFIDFDSSFLTQSNNVTVQAALYSIVNTATELPGVDRVVISVDGDSSFTYMDYNISGAYERNEDIISR